MDLHDTTFLVWTYHGFAMELHLGLIGQGTKSKGLTLNWQWIYKPSILKPRNKMDF
jgi:hypothetical protein